MAYFKVIVKVGHLGKGHSTEIPLYIEANNMYSAMKKAQKIPAVKHTRIPDKVQVITEEEFLAGREENKYIKFMQSINQDGRVDEKGNDLH